MPTQEQTRCSCPECRRRYDHPDRQYHQQLRLFLSRLSPQQRRLYAAVESNRLGWGGVARVREVTGLCAQTIARGRRQLVDLLQGKTLEPEWRPGPGRPRTEERHPAIKAALEELVSDEVAGMPDREQKWVRSSVAKLTKRLQAQGFQVGHNAVWALLKRMGFSLRTHVKKRRGISPDSADRDRQFGYIAELRREFGEAGLPAISVDTKKKELIGNFRPRGRLWCREAPEVDQYDFASQAECVATPFGVYDLMKNAGYVAVGVSHNTPSFAVSAIARWWREEGCLTYPRADRLLILADGGGGNGSRSRAWKVSLQEMLCSRFGLEVTVCHYPPGCSKWNPIERRLFSQISSNWEGKVLRTLGVMLGYIRGTTTTTGLTVKACLDEAVYSKGQRVTRQELEGLALKHHSVCSQWNYTISPKR
jgi:hypothetical protein